MISPSEKRVGYCASCDGEKGCGSVGHPLEQMGMTPVITIEEQVKKDFFGET